MSLHPLQGYVPAWDLNLGPLLWKASALPTELPEQGYFPIYYCNMFGTVPFGGGSPCDAQLRLSRRPPAAKMMFRKGLMLLLLHLIFSSPGLHAPKAVLLRITSKYNI